MSKRNLDPDHYVAPFDESQTSRSTRSASAITGPTSGSTRGAICVDGRCSTWPAIVIVVIVMALFPSLFTHVAPDNDC